MKIIVPILCHNYYKRLALCIESFIKYGKDDFEIHVASANENVLDETFRLLKERYKCEISCTESLTSYDHKNITDDDVFVYTIKNEDSSIYFDLLFYKLPDSKFLNKLYFYQKVQLILNAYYHDYITNGLKYICITDPDMVFSSELIGEMINYEDRKMCWCNRHNLSEDCAEMIVNSMQFELNHYQLTDDETQSEIYDRSPWGYMMMFTVDDFELIVNEIDDNQLKRKDNILGFDDWLKATYKRLIGNKYFSEDMKKGTRNSMYYKFAGIAYHLYHGKLRQYNLERNDL